MRFSVALPLYLNTSHAPVSLSLGEVGLNELLPAASNRPRSARLLHNCVGLKALRVKYDRAS
jgi:hypothetical protein